MHLPECSAQFWGLYAWDTVMLRCAGRNNFTLNSINYYYFSRISDKPAVEIFTLLIHYNE